ncbi:MAG TPA: NAD(P)H-hydrate dehydratase [Cellulomonadaceae bacterium]|nr:NAD(P)H-hydrate dehydratase [Cellulomonadaceae bacterium]
MSGVILGYDAHQVREAEEPLLTAGPAGELMHRAAFGLAGAVARELVARRGRVRGASVVGLVGTGNNGGDTLHALAMLADRGARALAVLTDERVHPAGLAAVRRSPARVVTLSGTDPTSERVWLGEAVAEAYAADVVLDGLLGIGAHGAVRGVGGELVRLLGELLRDEVRTAPGTDLPCVVAVDVPSGVGIDDGTLPGAVGGAAGHVLPADVTVTFGAAKPCLLLPPAAAAAGRVEVVDIGLRPGLGGPTVVRLEPADVAALWPVPGPAAHKYSRGVLGLVAGTAAYPGAAVLAASGAVLAGVGMVRYLGPDVAARAVLAAHPEVVVGDGRVQAWAIGSGVDPTLMPATDPTAEQVERLRRVLARAVAHSVPTVADAGALALLPDRLPPWVVLTPHAGELARLLTARLRERRTRPESHGTGGPAAGDGPDGSVTRAQVEAEPLRWARLAHELTGATVLLKGAVTVVVGPQGAVYAQADGPAWLATAGAGDVLTGVLGALLASRATEVVEDPTLAAALAAAAALVHGRAAHHANPGGPVTALAVAAAVPATVAGLLA